MPIQANQILQPSHSISQFPNVKLIEQEILKTQNFYGSWDYNSHLWSLFCNKDTWANLLNGFTNKFSEVFLPMNYNIIISILLQKGTTNELCSASNSCAYCS